MAFNENILNLRGLLHHYYEPKAFFFCQIENQSLRIVFEDLSCLKQELPKHTATMEKGSSLSIHFQQHPGIACKS